ATVTSQWSARNLIRARRRACPSQRAAFGHRPDARQRELAGAAGIGSTRERVAHRRGAAALELDVGAADLHRLRIGALVEHASGALEDADVVEAREALVRLACRVYQCCAAGPALPAASA